MLPISPNITAGGSPAHNTHMTTIFGLPFKLQPGINWPHVQPSAYPDPDRFLRCVVARPTDPIAPLSVPFRRARSEDAARAPWL